MLANFSTESLMLSMLVAKDNLTYPGAPNADPGTTAKLIFQGRKLKIQHHL